MNIARQAEIFIRLIIKCSNLQWIIFFHFFFQASQYGFLHLHDIAAEERKHLPPLVIPTFDTKSPKYVDHISDTYLKQCNVSNLCTPYKVSDNGSCLFNSVSLSLCGSQDMATELRVRTCIEMVMKKKSNYISSYCKTCHMGLAKLRYFSYGLCQWTWLVVNLDNFCSCRSHR